MLTNSNTDLIKSCLGLPFVSMTLFSCLAGLVVSASRYWVLRVCSKRYLDTVYILLPYSSGGPEVAEDSDVRLTAVPFDSFH